MINEEIQSAVKDNTAILGYRESIKFLKASRSKLIVISHDVPENVRREVEHIAKLSDSRFEIFNGNNRELGTLCGKPFPVSVLAIKG